MLKLITLHVLKKTKVNKALQKISTVFIKSTFYNTKPNKVPNYISLKYVHIPYLMNELIEGSGVQK
jgi:uncharacterized protein (UPF0128 family)